MFLSESLGPLTKKFELLSVKLRNELSHCFFYQWTKNLTFVKPVLIVIQLTVPLIYLKCISTAMICHRYLLYTFSDKELN